MISWAVVAISAIATFWAWRDPYFFFGALDLLWLVVEQPESRPSFWDPRYLLVSSLLHHDFAHLAVNALYLLIFGVVIERGMPARNYLFLLLVLLLGAKAASNFLTGGPSIGMSGVVYGLMGFFLLPYFRRKVPIFFIFYVFWVPAWALAAARVGDDIRQLLFGDSRFTDHWAHLGGFFVGYFFAWILRWWGRLA